MTAWIDSPLFREISVFLLRISAGLLMVIFHGWNKLAGVFSYIIEGEDWGFIGSVDKLGIPLPGLFAILAALCESLLAILIVIGFQTRLAALFLFITMSVAFYRHVTTDWNVEPALIYLVIFLFFAVRGAGKYSVDAFLASRKKESNNKST